MKIKMGDSMTTEWLRMKVTFGEFNRFKNISTIGMFRVRHVKIQSHVVKTLFPALFHPLNPIVKIWTFGPSGTVKRNSTKCYYLPCSLSDKLFDKKVESISLDNWTNSKRLEIRLENLNIGWRPFGSDSHIGGQQWKVNDF